MTRVAVLGTGAWGLNHVRVVGSTPGVELAAIVDIDASARDRARAIVPGVPCFTDAERVLADPSIDALVIATPSPSHVALATAALRGGKHILVEKPLALSTASAEQLAAVSHGPAVAMVGHLMVFHPAVVRLRELVQDGALGDVIYVRGTRANLGRYRADESVLWSFGPHELSILDFVLGEVPDRVSASGRCVVHPGIEDVVLLDLRYRSGVLAQFHLSRHHVRKERVLTVIGTKQTFELDDLAPTKLRNLDMGTAVVVPDGEPLRVQFEHFVDCIEQQTPPRADLASAIRVTRILDAAQRSLLTGSASKLD